MVPVGGFLAIILLAWKWGMKKAYKAIKAGPSNFWIDNAFMKGYLWVTIKYVAPVLIVIIFLQTFIRR